MGQEAFLHGKTLFVVPINDWITMIGNPCTLHPEHQLILLWPLFLLESPELAFIVHFNVDCLPVAGEEIFNFFLTELTT